MQFFTLSALTTLALASFAVAVPLGDAPSDQCNTGALQCCQIVQAADTPSVSSLLGILGVVVQGLTGQVGVTCDPISVIGASGNSWYALPLSRTIYLLMCFLPLKQLRPASLLH